MECENHPFEEEHHLPCCFIFSFQMSSFWRSDWCFGNSRAFVFARHLEGFQKHNGPITKPIFCPWQWFWKRTKNPWQRFFCCMNVTSKQKQSQQPNGRNGFRCTILNLGCCFSRAPCDAEFRKNHHVRWFNQQPTTQLPNDIFAFIKKFSNLNFESVKRRLHSQQNHHWEVRWLKISPGMPKMGNQKIDPSPWKIQPIPKICNKIANILLNERQ